ncbi:MAG: hypothetical protein ABUK08_05330, partial [Candidatus Humimicrobiaceae bacterium]
GRSGVVTWRVNSIEPPTSQEISPTTRSRGSASRENRSRTDSVFIGILLLNIHKFFRKRIQH